MGPKPIALTSPARSGVVSPCGSRMTKPKTSIAPVAAPGLRSPNGPPVAGWLQTAGTILPAPPSPHPLSSGATALELPRRPVNSVPVDGTGTACLKPDGAVDPLPPVKPSPVQADVRHRHRPQAPCPTKMGDRGFPRARRSAAVMPPARPRPCATPNSLLSPHALSPLTPPHLGLPPHPHGLGTHRSVTIPRDSTTELSAEFPAPGTTPHRWTAGNPDLPGPGLRQPESLVW